MKTIIMTIVALLTVLSVNIFAGPLETDAGEIRSVGFWYSGSERVIRISATNSPYEFLIKYTPSDPDREKMRYASLIAAITNGWCVGLYSPYVPAGGQTVYTDFFTGKR